MNNDKPQSQWKINRDNNKSLDEKYKRDLSRIQVNTNPNPFTTPSRARDDIHVKYIKDGITHVVSNSEYLRLKEQEEEEGQEKRIKLIQYLYK